MSTSHVVNQTTDRSPSFSGLNSAPLAVVTAVLFVFAISPVILCGNSLILSAIYRFKRLRTPSNYLLCSLATSDFGVGLFLPAGMYIELTGAGSCLIAYCVAITLCSASVIVMAAIAVDRFTSLSQPLRYNDLITHTSMQRYLIAFWLYSIIMGFSPAYYGQGFHKNTPRECSFPSLVDRTVQIILFCTIYGPSCAILVLCYAYIYVLARYHARAIYTVEISIRQGGTEHITVSRYGQTLAITVGCFVCLWMPFQSCMLVDIFKGTNLLENWMSIYLSLPIFASSAINPWIYGYRNSEIRASVQKVIEELLTKFGFPSQGCPENCRNHGEQAELNSFASNMRLCASSPNRTTTLLLTPRINGHFEKNTSLLTVPEGDIDFVVNSEPYLDQNDEQLTDVNNCVIGPLISARPALSGPIWVPAAVCNSPITIGASGAGVRVVGDKIPLGALAGLTGSHCISEADLCLRLFPFDNSQDISPAVRCHLRHQGIQVILNRQLRIRFISLIRHRTITAVFESSTTTKVNDKQIVTGDVEKRNKYENLGIEVQVKTEIVENNQDDYDDFFIKQEESVGTDPTRENEMDIDIDLKCHESIHCG